MTFGAPPQNLEGGAAEEWERPASEAAPPDDDRRWQFGHSASSDPEAQLERCRQRLAAAASQRKPSALVAAITQNSCTALSGGGDWARCRICPKEGIFEQVSGYYKAQKAKVYILSLIHISSPRDRQKSRMPSSA